MTDAGAAVLDVEDLSCRRGPRLLFERVCFAARAGDLVTVRGANGVGKTSLLRLVAGLSYPERGSIRWRGVSIHEDPASLRGSLAWLGHADGLKVDLSAYENLAFHRALCGGAGPVDDAVRAAGLEGFAGLPVRSLSAGQKRRTALARLLVASATLWILDEPMTALDADGQRWVEALVSGHCRNGGIVVMTSHQPFDCGLRPLEVAL